MTVFLKKSSNRIGAGKGEACRVKYCPSKNSFKSGLRSRWKNAKLPIKHIPKATNKESTVQYSKLPSSGIFVVNF